MIPLTLLYLLVNILIFWFAYTVEVDWYGDELRRMSAWCKVLEFNLVILIAVFLGLVIARYYAVS